MNWKWLSEFREFALKGNVVDLAVGVIIGGGLRQDRLGAGRERPDAADRLPAQAASTSRTLPSTSGTAQNPVLIKYGVFLQTLIDFAIIAFVLFLVIKGIITLKKRFESEAAAAPPKPTPSEIYLKEIRDALVKK